jgi:hypothetical protein
VLLISLCVSYELVAQSASIYTPLSLQRSLARTSPCNQTKIFCRYLNTVAFELQIVKILNLCWLPRKLYGAWQRMVKRTVQCPVESVEISNRRLKIRAVLCRFLKQISQWNAIRFREFHFLFRILEMDWDPNIQPPPSAKHEKVHQAKFLLVKNYSFY